MKKDKTKKDRYSRARGGASVHYCLSCAKCGEFLLEYQKDGVGSLLRLYLDRIKENKNLESFGEAKDKAALPALKCGKCGLVIGVPMVYAPEKRLAFRLVRGTFKKEQIAK